MSAPLIGQQWQEQLRALKPNWDNYSASAISEAAMDTVCRFAVVPCCDGGIQLEIHQDTFGIEIEIGADGKISGALVAREEPP